MTLTKKVGETVHFSQDWWNGSAMPGKLWMAVVFNSQEVDHRVALQPGDIVTLQVDFQITADVMPQTAIYKAYVYQVLRETIFGADVKLLAQEDVPN